MLVGEQEGEEMEKSAGRPSSVPPRPNGADSKKENGSSQNKRRSNRRRESNGRADGTPRKQYAAPPAQRLRPNDKRPRARGYYNDRQKQTVSGEEGAEQGSVQKPGSKKQNYNHLLNFSYGPAREAGPERRGGRPGWSGGRRAVRFNKEQFLQANCQFVVAEGGDYSLHSADPDTLVEWSCIEQVRLLSQGVPSCPICLYPPVAAKLTRCGHIYCWPCMLHYLSLADKSWAKCPICFEAVHESDLKSVQSQEAVSPAVGETVSLTLMRRARGSTLAVPAAWPLQAEAEWPVNVEAAGGVSCKLLAASPDQVLRLVVEPERTALQVQLADEEQQSLEASFTRAALTALAGREEALAIKAEAQRALPALTPSPPELEPLVDAEPEPPKPEHNRKVTTYSSAFSDDEEEVLEEAAALDTNDKQADDSKEEENDADKKDEEETAESQSEAQDDIEFKEHGEEELKEEPKEGEELKEELKESEELPAELENNLTVEEAESELALPATQVKHNDHVYFYQASDGQPLFVHSLNARSLVRDYGALADCPHTITAAVVESESVTMSQELRGRLRYLSHLPLTCHFQVLELALLPPAVSVFTLQHFAEETQRRRRQRQKRSRDERRKLRAMAEEECRKIDSCPELRSLKPFLQPSESRSVFVPSEAPGVRSPLSTSPESTGSSEPRPSPADGGGQTTNLSFAQMLRAGKTRASEAWPRVPGGGEVPRRGADSESGDEERVPVPTYSQSFGDAIQAALDSANKGEEPAAAAPPGGGGKKKKKLKKLLFSTSMPRAK